MDNYEMVVMNLISNAGDARSKAFEAIRTARQGEIEKAVELLEEGEASLNEAHLTQTKLIQAEVRGEEQKMTLLMVHAQDHLMTAMTVHELAQELVEDYKDRRK